MTTEQKLKHVNDLIKTIQLRIGTTSRIEYETLAERIKTTIKRICPPNSKYISELDTTFRFDIHNLYDAEQYYKGLLLRLRTELELDLSIEETPEIISETDFENLPLNISEIYSETLLAFKQNQNYLCSGGLRAIIESICKDNEIKGGTDIDTGKYTLSLKGRIYGLAEMNLITIQNAKILTHHQYLGDKALHELKKPSKDELKIAIDIINFTLTAIYELEHKGIDLQQKTQNRLNKK